jgi:hypothetical protein
MEPVIYIRPPECGDGPPIPIPWFNDASACEHKETACVECVASWWEDWLLYFHAGGGVFVSVDDLLMAERPMPTPVERAL